jgi:spoIIIJ-associated protein
MSDIYEFEAKTKDDAVRKACEELGVSEDKLEVEVLSFGSTGIFGLVGAKKAKIKVVLPGEPPQERVEEEIPEAKEEGSVAETAQKSLEDILAYIADDATVKATESTDGDISLRIEASNPAILIGRHGKTLDALQYIVRKIVRKQLNAKERISFDVGGYRDRRKESLTQLALRLGAKVKRSGRPATINPMNAYDRRIVHIALKDDASVRTQSKGGGAFRKLVILPQKKAR